MRDRFLHITDLHFWSIPKDPRRWWGKRAAGLLTVLWRRRFEYRTELAAEFAAFLAAQHASGVLATGDFSSTALEDEFTQASAFLDALRADGRIVWALPGNHDLYTGGAFRARRFEHYLTNFLPAENSPCRRLLPGGTPIVFAPTACPDIMARGHITPDTIAAVAQLVREAPPGPVVITAHYPLLHTTRDYHSIITRRLRNAEPLRRALGETGRHILYIAGHVHRSSYTQDHEFEGLTHLTTPALFRQRRMPPLQGAFSEIEVREEGFTVALHRLEGESWRREILQPTAST